MIEELLARRNQEEFKFRKSVETIKELIASKDTATVKHLVGAVRDARKKLDDRMIACERA